MEINVSSMTLTPETARIMYNRWSLFHYELRKRMSLGDFDYQDLALSEEQWIELHPILDADGGPLPPTSRFPAPPAQLANGATHVQESNHANQKATHKEVLKTAAALKDALITSLGEDIADELRDPLNGLADVDYWNILQHMQAVYGTLNRSDVNQIQNDIRIYLPEKSFQTNAARQAKNFAQLAPLNMYTSEMDKIEAFLDSIKSISIFQPLITD